MKPYTLFILFLSGMLLFPQFSCSSDNDHLYSQIEDPDQDNGSGSGNGNNGGTEAVKPEAIDPEDGELNPNTRDISGLFEHVVSITFSDAEASIDNPFENDGVTITRTGAHVTANSTRTDIELTYALSGITTDGSFKIYGGNKFNLV
ncbi:MAG: hypothetical protein LUD68_11365, partial [Rikenellaceae bacterium]|nr:hypothetical protein [Rikenellaceae bacterium]